MNVLFIAVDDMNNCVRWKQWNYINHRDGSEELYNHDEDPNEWHNLAGNAEYRALMDELKESLPTVILHE